MKNSFVAKIIFISLLSSNLRASSKPDNHKEEDKIRSVLCPARTRLDPETKRLFIPSTMPFRFFMNPLVEGSTPIALEQTAENPEKYLHFPEGEHNIAIPATSKQVYRLVADANPPVTGISLAEVPHVDKYGKSFYGKGFSVTLTAIDSVSGLDKIFMALNGSHFSELMKSMLRFPENGEFKLQYFSCDRVGNKEALQRLEFSVDVTAPVTSLQVKNPGNGSALGPNAFLALRSLDAGVGVANIEYQFDGGPKKIYESELALSELVSGKHSLVYWASDHLQNREISHKFDFNLDLLAPELSVSFLGPSYRETDLVFVSNSTKIQLDSQDKQSGVSSVKYAINGKYQVPKSNTISLSGLNGLQNFVGLVTDQAGNATKLEEKILMDSEAPAVEYEFIGSSFFHDNQFVVSSPLQIKLIAKDKASGIDKVFYCLNDLPCKIYQDVIAINSPGPMSFSFYAQDRVQNLSPKKTLRLLLKDNKSNASAKPKSEKMQWVSDRESGAIGPAGQRYRLEIADGPGLDALKFSFNIPKYILESDSIRSGPLQKIRLSLAGYQADIAIPIDAEAPRSKHSFTGAKTFRREEKDYFGPGLKISFTADDKSDYPNSGTRKILYSINGAPFSIFESPLSQFLAEQTYVFHY
ncbi:MAG: hypothetical protein NTX25_03070, partial [Proteobacteria bacterium]|nr:hypothetical protein [Pseudomonadota bacterium]